MASEAARMAASARAGSGRREEGDRSGSRSASMALGVVCVLQTEDRRCHTRVRNRDANGCPRDRTRHPRSRRSSGFDSLIYCDSREA